MKLGVGTVQFGLDYGISNAAGKTSTAEARSLLSRAAEAGLDLLDTAPKYGDSEQVIGAILSQGPGMKIVTKTPQFGLARILRQESDCLVATFHDSLARLRTPSLYGLLIHQPEDLLVEGGEVLFDAMQRLKSAQLVEKVGVSVYTGTQIDRILERFEIDLIQLPLNVLDQRLRESGHLAKLKKRGIEIHVRSVFLQGVLLMEPGRLPSHFDALKPALSRYRAVLAGRGITPIRAALGFLRTIEEIDYAILGFSSVAELDEVLGAWDPGIADAPDFSQFSCREERFINPTLWANFRDVAIRGPIGGLSAC